MKHFCFFVFFLALSAGCISLAGQEEKPVMGTFQEMWQRVEKLQEEQKYAAALEQTQKIYEKAVAEEAQQEWAKSLIRTVLLQRSLHTYEQSVLSLMEKKWPADSVQKALVHLFYANTLMDYYNSYSWDINQREKVSSTKGTDLKKWTAMDIFEEANKQYASAFQYGKELSNLPVKNYSEYIHRGKYPSHICASLYDFLVMQWAAFLGNTTIWKPTELKEKYLLDLEVLLAPPEKREEKDNAYFLNTTVHPLMRMVHLLDKLYLYHQNAGNTESALESQLERIRRVVAVFDREDQVQSAITTITKLLSAYESFPWWAVGKHDHAIMLQKQGKFFESHAAAKEGVDRYPKSLGGELCAQIIKVLEMPYFELNAMRLDKTGAPSIKIVHKNITKLYFRTYKINFAEWMQRKYSYWGAVDMNDVRKIMKHNRPNTSMEMQINDLGDYETHTTYMTPDVKENGFYLVSVSAKPDFPEASNQIKATYIMFSDFVTIVSSQSEGWDVAVVEGKTGKPVPEAQVTLYRYDYNKGPIKMTELTTSSEGRVHFPYRHRMGSCFIVASKNKDYSYDASTIYFSRYEERPERQGCFIYTDRSIYRPMQKLYFKIVTYQGDIKTADYKGIVNTEVSVEFKDPNGKPIDTVKTKTNEYGTASGEFTIPQGRVLGYYYLRCQAMGVYGHASIKVEEYKRPTFEVTMKKPEQALKLNEKISVTGEARYYFGLPVSTGKVFYRVTRIPVWPWWYWWFYSNRNESRYTYEIASGNTELNKDGGFTVQFVPKADPGLSSEKDITYNFKVDVEITDEGGETRTSQSTYPIGFVAVQASFDFPSNFFMESEDAKVTINRTDLSGVAREGNGEYRLVRLQQPDGVVTPDKFPIMLEKGKKYTEGDKQRPRWEDDKELSQYLFTFKDGEDVNKGTLTHDKEGKADVSLGKLTAGAYRLYYTTKDTWNTEYQTKKEFLVAGVNMKLALPLFALVQKEHLKVGETAFLFYGSGIENQNYWVELLQGSTIVKRTLVESGKPKFDEIVIKEEHRGGFTVRVTGLYDYRLYSESRNICVPWDNKYLQISFGKFRNLLRPGQKETWTVNVKGPKSEIVTAELLAYMYDRSLDMFVQHHYPSLDGLMPSRLGTSYVRSNLSQIYFEHIFSDWPYLSNPEWQTDTYIIFNGYPVGGAGNRGNIMYEGKAEEMSYKAKGGTTVARAPAPTSGMRTSLGLAKDGNGAPESKPQSAELPSSVAAPDAKQEEAVPIREKFHETAFFKPHLITNKDGDAEIEFEVPDSVTSWNFYVHAMTKELNFMTRKETVVTSKDLMVRPYVPRFFREGDEATLKVVVNNATDKPLAGDVSLVVLDPKTETDKSADFGITVKSQTWEAQGKQSANLSWNLKAPHNLATYAFKVVARTKEYSDGELRPIPVLPGRMHLVQSKFVTLNEKQPRTLYISDLEKSAEDSTLVHQSLVVTVDAQLVYATLKALPYLVDYPYECVEQTMNRFVCTGIVSSLYKKYPVIENMAKEFSKRSTQLDPWHKEDPNRKMSLEETPWLVQAEGGDKNMERLINILDPKIAAAQKEASLEKLRQAQNGDGSFPWWSGGPGSPYMTLYLLHGLAKAQEFNVEVPKDMILKAWIYLGGHFRDYYAQKMVKEDYGFEFITFLNYVLSCYPDTSYYQGAFSAEEREQMLQYSFTHWKKHCPYLKAYLALTLSRAKRAQDAQLVMDSIMDSAITKEDQGTFWAPEDRSWLWYNDTIESHAFILRALQEVMPHEKKYLDGLVLWLLLNKKMNQWKSTKATAEVVYTLVYTMDRQQALGMKETASVTLADKKHEFVFEPDRYTGEHNQILVPGKEIVPQTMARAQVEKTGPGFAFASMTWHYSTEKMPTEARGDFLSVQRSYYLRKHEGQEYVLRPISEGAIIAVGDQVEVHLSIRSKHPMEYVHLRDPRGAGFEPEKPVSGHRWDLGIYWYEEIRDSGTNFFFEYLPQGEYNFHYRIRATMAGKFKVGPATIQSMYAPEFAAFSTGAMLDIK